MASHEIILVATCEPTSLTDAYSMLKVLSKHEYNGPVKVVINQVKSGKAAQKAYAQLKKTVHRFLSIKVEPLGIVVSDKNVRAAVISQTPFFLTFPDTIASKCIKSITGKLIKKADRTGDIPVELFWDKCLSFLEKYHKPKPKPVLQNDLDAKKDIDSQKVLFRIESRLSTLIKEVDGIKQLLENFKVLPKKKRNEKALKPPEPKQHSLDFESWLKKKKQR